MRFVFLVLVVCTTLPLYAQRVFRASRIDLEQNERLDTLEQRMDMVESAVTQDTLTTAPAPPKAKPPKVEAKPRDTYFTSAELRSLIRQHGQWTGQPKYADVSPRSAVRRHLQNEHRFTAKQVRGLSQSESLALHDYAHGGIIKPTIAVRGTRLKRMREPKPARSTTLQSYRPVGGGCANGRCARQSTTSRGGWRPGRLLFGR